MSGGVVFGYLGNKWKTPGCWLIVLLFLK